MKQPKLILASQSPRRQELLRQIGLTFTVCPSGASEQYLATTPEEIVQELARTKAEEVAGRILSETPEDTLVLGADTLVVLNGEKLGKPADDSDAVRMLTALQGQCHQVYTGVVFVGVRERKIYREICHTEKTNVWVHEMTPEEIRDYVAGGEPMDKAGSYGIQGPFAAYIDRIEGDFYNVVGLPLSYVYHQIAGWQDDENDNGGEK